MTALPLSLFLKSKLVGTRIEQTAKRARWVFGTTHRVKHPEIRELLLEEERMPLVVSKILRSDSCGVDVGAHIGSFLSLLMKYAPRGKHVAIEPSLQKSAWLRKRFPDAEILQIAISDQSGDQSFEEDHVRPGFSKLGESGADHTSHYMVPTKRLDDIAIRRVDLLKLDIEGHEFRALHGAEALISSKQPTIIFECGPDCEERAKLYELLGAFRYNVYSFTDFLFPDKGSLSFDEFRKCGVYPYRAFNFVAMPSSGQI